MNTHQPRSRRQVPAPWRGVRLAVLPLDRGEEGLAPAAATIPVDWPVACAAGLIALSPPAGAAPVHIIEAATGWIKTATERAGERALALDGAVLHAALRDRCAAPSVGIWRGEPERVPGFVLNLPQFIDSDGAFDRPRFGAVTEAAVLTLAMLAPQAEDVAVGIADLALFLAQLDLDYGAQAAREQACAVVDLLATHAARASARLVRLGLRAPQRQLGILPAGAVEQLLGVETIGFAAPMSALDGEGRLARWARARLAARGQSAESALALSLAGHDPFGVADVAAIRAMGEVLTPLFATLPEPPAMPAWVGPRSGTAQRAMLPARRSGYTQKASIGGHKFFLRTGEYPDGRLGEVFIALPKENAAMRGFADSFAIAVSVGLQHDVPLSAYVDALADTHFGAAGAVEGDPAVRMASSPVDYVCKHLGANYLGRQEPAEASEPASDATETAPLLPLDLPDALPQAEPVRPRRVRAHLKLVS